MLDASSKASKQGSSSARAVIFQQSFQDFRISATAEMHANSSKPRGIQRSLRFFKFPQICAKTCHVTSTHIRPSPIHVRTRTRVQLKGLV